MARFHILGAYRFCYRDEEGEEFVCVVDAANDDDALTLAREAQHGMALDVWAPDRLVERLAMPHMFRLEG